MKTDTTLFMLALAAIGILFYKAQSTSTAQNASSATSGAGGPPSWASYAGPMGAKYNPLTGTMEMAPLPVKY